MAISITQQPTTPNAAYTSLPYVVSGSTTTGNPQYSYVMDIYESGSSVRLNRITQVPNPAGVAVFDPSRFLQNQLEYTNSQKEGYYEEINSNKLFEFKFGEAYSTSVSSSVTVYPDLASSSLSVFNSYTDPGATITTYWEDNYGNIEGNYKPKGYNFNSSSFSLRDVTTTSNDEVLSNNPFMLQEARRVFPESQQDFEFLNSGSSFLSSPKNYVVTSEDDYGTVSLMRYLGTPGTIYADPGDRWCIYLEVYDKDNTNLFSGNTTYTINNNRDIATLAANPQNLKTIFSTAFDGDWSHYSVNYISAYPQFASCTGASWVVFFVKEGFNATAISNLQFGAYGPAFPRPMKVGGDKMRFAWINKYGVWDYHNIYSVLKRDSNVQRENVSLPKVDYSSITSTYSQESRGETSYYSETNDSYSITTDYIDKPEANWLEELLESPEVYVQQGSEFVPVVITDTNYTSNQSTPRNKTFQYTINFKPANGRDLYSTPVNCGEPIVDYKSWTLVSGSTVCELCEETPAQTFYTVHTVERLDVGIEVFTSSSLSVDTQLSNVNLSDGSTVYQIPAGNDQHITQIAFCEYQTVTRCKDGIVRRFPTLECSSSLGLEENQRIVVEDYPFDDFIWYVSGTTTDTSIPVLSYDSFVTQSAYGCPPCYNIPVAFSTATFGTPLTDANITGSCCTAGVVTGKRFDGPTLATSTKFFADTGDCLTLNDLHAAIREEGSTQYYTWNPDTETMAGPFDCPDCP